MNDDDPVLTEQELFEYLRFGRELKSVTRRSVKHAVINREIVPTRISEQKLVLSAGRRRLDQVAEAARANAIRRQQRQPRAYGRHRVAPRRGAVSAPKSQPAQ